MDTDEYDRCRAFLKAAFPPDLPEEFVDFIADRVADTYVWALDEAQNSFEPEMTARLSHEKVLSGGDFECKTLYAELCVAALAAEESKQEADFFVFRASRANEMLWIVSHYCNSYEGATEETMWSFRVTRTRQVWNSGRGFDITDFGGVSEAESLQKYERTKPILRLVK